MPISINLPDDFFETTEKEKLMDLFGVDTDAEFSQALERITLAALSEYKDMFLGMGLPSRADEIRQHRLYHLIKNYFQGRLPTEAEVSSMFQLPETRSSNLILYVITRFRYALEEEIINTLRETVSTARYVDDLTKYRLAIQSKNIVEELNKIISRNAPELERIKPERKMARIYSISVDAYRLLCEYFGIEIEIPD